MKAARNSAGPSINSLYLMIFHPFIHVDGRRYKLTYDVFVLDLRGTKVKSFL